MLLGLGLRHVTVIHSRNVLEKHTKGSESLVSEMNERTSRIQSTTRHEKSCWNKRGPPRKAKYYLMTDSEAVP